MASDQLNGHSLRSVAELRAARLNRRYAALFVTQDEEVWEQVQAEFAARKRFHVYLFAGSVAQLAENVHEVEHPDLLAVDLTHGGSADVEALERLRKSTLANVPVVVISNHLDQQLVRSLMHLKVDDWLPSGCAPAELHSSCEQALLAGLTKPSGAETRCTTFVPAVGGCGATTLAIEAALVMTNRDKPRQTTCLVDLNFQDGAISDYLDLAPSFQVSELSGMSERLDRQLLDVMLSRHRLGLSVLACPRSPGQFLDVSDDTIASILGLLAESFQHLIIDLPKVFSPWTDNVIWGSDRVYVVTAFTVPALRQARLMSDAISAKANPKTEVSVLVNKYHEPLMGPGLTRRDAEAILGSRLQGFIPSLGSMVDEAINRGMPLSEVRPGNRISKRLAQLFAEGAQAAALQQH